MQLIEDRLEKMGQENVLEKIFDAENAQEEVDKEKKSEMPRKLFLSQNSLLFSIKKFLLCKKMP